MINANRRKNGKTQNVTLKDIAEIASVSITTVSRALADKRDIGNSTKRKIREIAERFDYRPNEVARSLILQKTYSIGLVICEITNPFYSRLAASIERHVKKNDYSLFLAVHSTHEEKDECIRMLQRKKVDGIILVPVFYKKDIEMYVNLQSGSTPFVICGNIEFLECDSVTINRTEAVEKVLRHLIEQNRKKIGYLCVSDTAVAFSTKLRGFEEALYRFGIKCNRDWMIEGQPTLEDGYRKMEKMLALKNRPDAIFCHNDLVAIGAMKAIKDNGLSIPDDIAVAGFDNIAESRFYDPGLTTVDQPVEQMSLRLVELLLKRIENPHGTRETIVLESELIVRDSTVTAQR